MEVLVNLGDVPLLKRSRFLGLFITPLLDALVVVTGPLSRAPGYCDDLAPWRVAELLFD
jgi:hypothetical protein